MPERVDLGRELVRGVEGEGGEMTSNIEYPISNIEKGISKPKCPPPINIQYSVLDIGYSVLPENLWVLLCVAAAA